MSKLTKDTWILVADGEKALFLINRTDAQNPHFDVVRKTEQDNPPTRDQAANRPGRFNDGPNAQKSAVDDTDWHELAKDRFAEDLADMLYKRAHAQEFERIVLVADPGTLGKLRDELHQVVRGKIVGEVDKTLTNHPLDEIEKVVKSELDAA